MTRRRPTPDEMELWQRVVRKAERLHPPGRQPAQAVPLPGRKPKKPAPPPMEPFTLGQSAAPSSPTAHDLKPALRDHLARAPLSMNRKTFARMVRGKLKPDARIDLHGRRLDEAHTALVRFILTSQASGRRLVLVITGKGRSGRDEGPIPTPRGVLRHQVPQWLALPPLSQAVLQVTPAHASHGGEGAYYVYLRRPR